MGRSGMGKSGLGMSRRRDSEMMEGGEEDEPEAQEA